MLILATASAADEITPGYWYFVSGCLLVAAAVSLVALILAGMSRMPSRCSKILAGFSVAISMFPVVFSVYVHRIDYVAVGGDGAPASDPLWRVLIIPVMPVIVAILAVVVGRSRCCSGYARKQRRMLEQTSGKEAA